MRQDDFNFICSTCQEPLDYDPGEYPCEKCEWWLEEERKEQERYERMMWERQQYERELCTEQALQDKQS
jgi:hypothetical protein